MRLTSHFQHLGRLALVVEEFHSGMLTQTPRRYDRSQSDVIGVWFRALDQRRIRVGHREWLLHVTGIFSGRDDNVWIQIADAHADGGSILLRVSSATSVEDALHALEKQRLTAPAHPIVISATAMPLAAADFTEHDR